MVDLVGSRTLLVLHDLGNKLDDAIPTNHDLLRYREQIAEGNPSDLNKLLHLERNLAQERMMLKSQIEFLTNDWKKKEIVIAKSRLQVVEKKRIKTTKELNRLIMSSDEVMGNMRKLVEELQSVKVQLEMRMDPKSIDVNFQMLETTIKKKEAALVKENILKEYIANLKKMMEEQEIAKKHLEEKEIEVEEAKSELDMNQSGENPILRRLFRDVITDRDSKKRLFLKDEKKLREDIEHFETQLGYENESYRLSGQFLNERLESLKSKVMTLESKNNEEILVLDSEATGVKNRREENLKDLLKLRMQWRQYESEKRDEETTAVVKHEEEENRKKRIDAADFIQRRLFLLYRLKFKNMPKASPSKKMRKSKKQ